MKKLIIKSIAFILIIAALILPMSISVDPYNVFHTKAPRDNGIESNKGFIKTEYIKKNHDKFDSLLFGSSRAGFYDIGYLNEKMGAKFYDMASSESLVNEEAKELKVLIKAGFVPKNVLVLVDDISCFVDPKIHENMLYRVPYPDGGFADRMEFYLKYMDLITVANSMSVIKDHKAKVEAELVNGVDNAYDNSTHMSYTDRFYETGTERLDKESQFDPNEEQYQKGYWVDYYDLRVEEALNDMKELKKLCDDNGINLIVMTNPLYHLTYEQDIENGYLIYLRGIADITDYYNFSGFSEVTEDYHYYYETSHFMPEVTRMMTDAFLASENASNNHEGISEESVFGCHVTSENVDEIISILEEQAIKRGISVYQCLD
ncbi:MAG: hypothetical protein Q4D29_02045 [Lachnospiraceae bacterium]|nr:hypothetical protein [Lachnospiraceae bacterium]